MKILHLTLKKKWFDMILSGEKREEYRDIKPYWKKRLLFAENGCQEYPKDFDIIRFKNGYQKDAREMDVKFEGLSISNGIKEWGADMSKLYYTIVLGKIRSTKNCN